MHPPIRNSRTYVSVGTKKVVFDCFSILLTLYLSGKSKETIQINHQPDAKIFQFIILTFIYSSKCFGRSPPIIRSSMTAVKASGFTFVSWWQPCCVRGRVGPTTNTARLSPRYEDKTRGCFRIINWKINCCIWLVIYLNCTMMHGLTNLKCTETTKCSGRNFCRVSKQEHSE